MTTTTPFHSLQTPGQRTAVTARAILIAGSLAWTSAWLKQSLTGATLASLLLLAGGALWFAARRAD